jgi:Flp pilus assembly protein TadG
VKTLLRDESGQTLIFVAVSMTVILGFVAMATDVGTFLHDKRNLQIAADSAAIAGAMEEYSSGVTADIQAAGQRASTQDGFTNGSNQVTVAVHPPPVDGPHTGAGGYVEAIVSQVEPVFFMKLFSFPSMTVSARAVAFNGATFSCCLCALNATQADTIELQGNFTVTAANCDVNNNSSSASALDFTGGAGTLTAAAVGVVGGVAGHTGDSTPPAVTGIAPLSDPLASLPAPTYSAASCAAPPNGTTWGPATAGGTVCYSGNISVKQNITMSAGTYVFTGDLDFTGNGSLTGTGVTLYFAGPNGQLGGPGNGNTTLNLTAPTSGAYNGILIYQDPTDTNLGELNGTPITNFVGVVYMPGAELELSGNTTMNLTSNLIVNQFYEKGNGTITITPYSSTIGTPLLSSVALVE